MKWILCFFLFCQFCMADSMSTNENQFYLTAQSNQVSSHCTPPDRGAVFAYITVETKTSINEFIYRRHWGRNYCHMMKNHVDSLLKKGGKVYLVGTNNTTSQYRQDQDDQGTLSPPLNKRIYNISIFDSITNQHKDCVGYFSKSCPIDTTQLND